MGRLLADECVELVVRSLEAAFPRAARHRGRPA
jgi:hypothetical protein